MKIGSIESSASQRHDPWQTHTVKIRSILKELSDVSTFEFSFLDDRVQEEFSFETGQFNMLYLPGIGEAAISISSAPSDTSTIHHTIRFVGNVTGKLNQLNVDETIGLRGPFGSAWPLSKCQGGDVLIVTGGIGLAPLRPAIYELLRRRDEFGRLTLLYGARTPSELLYMREFDAWSERGMDVQTTVDRGHRDWLGNVGVVTQLIDRMSLPNPAQTSVLCCGPEVMMWFAARSAQSHGIPSDRIWISLERNMNCAIGLCGHCQFGSAFICTDGPVLCFDQVSPYLRVEGF